MFKILSRKLTTGKKSHLKCRGKIEMCQYKERVYCRKLRVSRYFDTILLPLELILPFDCSFHKVLLIDFLFIVVQYGHKEWERHAS